MHEQMFDMLFVDNSNKKYLNLEEFFVIKLEYLSAERVRFSAKLVVTNQVERNFLRLEKFQCIETLRNRVLL